MRKILSIWLCILLSSCLCFSQDSTTQKSNNSLINTALLPSIGITAGLYSRINNLPLNKFKVNSVIQKKHSSFHNNLDDYMQFVPIAGAYGLHLTNLESTNDVVSSSIGLLASHFIMAGIVFPAKYLIGDRRPNMGAANAFPSGHTAEAFLAAHFLWKEYGKRYPVIGVIGYGCAVTTGIFRMLNNEHWSADVLAGAGVGILSVNLGYICLDWYKKNHTKRHF